MNNERFVGLIHDTLVKNQTHIPLMCNIIENKMQSLIRNTCLVVMIYVEKLIYLLLNLISISSYAGFIYISCKINKNKTAWLTVYGVWTRRLEKMALGF